MATSEDAIRDVIRKEGQWPPKGTDLNEYAEWIFKSLSGSAEQPAVVLQALIEPQEKVSDGFVVQCMAIPWHEIARRVSEDPEFLLQFVGHHRKFEEFLAATYDRAGFDEVILTPQRGDRGRDVIAIKKGYGSIRILDQAKAYKPGHLVTHDDVRAMLGVLTTDRNSSKVVISTTSDFQPGIIESDEFADFMPYRLELKNGKNLARWIANVANEQGTQAG